MSEYTWDSKTLIDDLRDENCLKALYVTEAKAIAGRTGFKFVPSQDLANSLSRVAAQYENCLDAASGQAGLAGDAPIAAVKSMYLFMHSNDVTPTFEDNGGTIHHEFERRLMDISPKATCAHQFCFRFLALTGFRHFRIPPIVDELSEVDALIESTIKSYDTRPDLSFEHIRVRVFRREWPKLA